MAHDELEFVAWLREHAPRSPQVDLGLGDDMGSLSWPEPSVFIASDWVLDGVHVDTRRHSLAHIGRKALARNLSDCAAMAVRPIAATLSLAMPRSMTSTDAQSLAEGLFSLAREFEVAVVGGDTARWDHPLAIDVAITAATYPSVQPVTRAGARVGDRLFVSGPLGGSILGRHLSFTPRVREARTLAEKLGNRLHAMIDVSDGLALDLWRLCQASRAGAEIRREELHAALHDDAKRLETMDGVSAIDHALGDGEDFELLFAAEGPLPELDFPVYPIGTVTASGLHLCSEGGAREELPVKGYVH